VHCQRNGEIFSGDLYRAKARIPGARTFEYCLKGAVKDSKGSIEKIKELVKQIF